MMGGFTINALAKSVGPVGKSSLIFKFLSVNRRCSFPTNMKFPKCHTSSHNTPVGPGFCNLNGGFCLSSSSSSSYPPSL